MIHEKSECFFLAKMTNFGSGFYLDETSDYDDIFDDSNLEIEVETDDSSDEDETGFLDMIYPDKVIDPISKNPKTNR